MTSTETGFAAGRPRLSRPIHWLARPLGPLGLATAGRRWFPFFAVLRLTGRRSGRAHATPVVALRAPDGFLIPLPFGDATQWARNLFAVGGGGLRFAGEEVRIADPRVVAREAIAGLLPGWVRFIAARVGLRQFIHVARVDV